MIKAAVIFNGEKKEINLPQKWAEVTLRDYKRIKEQGLIKALTGLNENDFNEDTLITITYALRFLKRKIKGFEPDYIKQLNIGGESWGKLEEAQQIFKIEEDHFLAAAKVCKVYLGVDLEDRPMTEIAGVLNHIGEKLTAFFEMFSELNEYTPDSDEIRAGVEELERFGFLNTLDRLAGGDVLKYDSILKEPAIKIYNKLLKDFIDSKIQKRLFEIKNKKK
jgi:hypothetical protein